LADFEEMPNGPTRSAAQLRDDMIAGRCHAFVALNDTDIVIGYLIYYYAYSTWAGPFVFMEDLYVTPAYQRQQVGLRLWQTLAKVSSIIL
jgi:predicted N-acetyltransferase YhbS